MKNGLGVGLGIAIGMYFLNLLTNITEDAKFLKYITPYAFTEGGEILQNRALSPEYVLIGMGLAAAAVAAAFIKYRSKDLAT